MTLIIVLALAYVVMEFLWHSPMGVGMVGDKEDV
jgi:hypothetical protein